MIRTLVGCVLGVRLDQFIAFVARYAFFSLFSLLKVKKGTFSLTL